MHLFDRLCEAKLQNWLQPPEAQRKAYLPSSQTTQTKAFESHLLNDSKRLIRLAFEQPDEALRITLLKQARLVEIQLLASLEKQGLPLIARMMQDELSQFISQRRQTA